MSAISLLMIAGAAQPRTAIVTLSGETVLTVDAVSPYDTFVAFRFNTDGTLDKGTSINGGALNFSQIDSATDWIIPNDAASIDYDVRIVSITGTLTSLAAAENTWIDLGTARTWTLNSTIQENITVTATFEIRDPVGTTKDTGAYTWTIQNTA